MEEEETGMVSCCRQPSEEEGRLDRENISYSTYNARLLFMMHVILLQILRMLKLY